MSPSAIVRSQARETLKGNYIAAVFAFVILLIPVYIIIGIESVFEAILAELISNNFILGIVEIVVLTPIVIVTVVLMSPLLTGYIRLFYRAGVTREMDMNEMFYYFQSGRYQKTLLLNLSLFVRLMLPAVICFLPLFVYYILCYNMLEDFVETTLFIDFAFILTILSVILLALYTLRYFLVFTLYFENDQVQISELFRISKAMMKQHSREASSLIFSFWAWLLLCMTVLPMLYVVPYMTQSLCIGAKWMMRAENERIMR